MRLAPRTGQGRTLWLRFGLGLLVSALALYLAVNDIALDEVVEALRLADWRLAGLALVSVAVNTVGKAARWKVLMGAPGRKISLPYYTMALLIGQMLNTLLPARLGEISRALTIGARGPGRVFTLGTVMLEKILDLLAYAFLLAALLVLIPLPAWVSGSASTLALLALGAAVATYVVAWKPGPMLRAAEFVIKWLPPGWRQFWMERFRAGFASLAILQSRAEAARLAAWTALIWGTALLNNVLVLAAFKLSLPLTASLLVLIGLQVGISAPSVPGRIGVFQYICILALAVFGVERTLALSYGILLHAVVFIPTTLLGLLFFWVLGFGNRQAVLMEAREGG